MASTRRITIDPRHRSQSSFYPSASSVLLSLLLVILLIAGGASRDNALGQVVVRGAAWMTLVAAIVWGKRPSFGRVRPILVFVLLALLLALLQLVPLPPGVWQALPGRAMFAEAASASGQAQPWRPWSIVPGATVNAASSLVVPLAVAVLMAGLKPQEHRWLPGLLLGCVGASMAVGMLQVSGTGFGNPLINGLPGQISGTFANRNHFALFMVLGCLLAPAWAFQADRPSLWRAPVALGLVLLFVLMILASGSRAGLVLGVLALAIGVVPVWQGLRRALQRSPTWLIPASIAGIVAMIAAVVAISFATDRAVSINRVFAGDIGQDMRARGLPVVLAMIRAYFPVGTGFGGFDPVFRIHEPLGLLKFTYFNHAHNDLLEIVLDAGLPGLLLLLSGLLWWGWASVRAWRAGTGLDYAAAKTGSAMLFLIVLASLFDYPARTPMIMAVIVVAGMWLSGGKEERRGSALPGTGQHL